MLIERGRQLDNPFQTRRFSVPIYSKYLLSKQFQKGLARNFLIDPQIYDTVRTKSSGTMGILHSNWSFLLNSKKGVSTMYFIPLCYDSYESIYLVMTGYFPGTRKLNWDTARKLKKNGPLRKFCHTTAPEGTFYLK